MIKMNRRHRGNHETIQKQNNYKTFQFIWAVSLIKKQSKTEHTHLRIVQNLSLSLEKKPTHESHITVTVNNTARCAHSWQLQPSRVLHGTRDHRRGPGRIEGTWFGLFSFTVLVRHFHGCVFSARRRRWDVDAGQQPIQRSKTLDELQ